MLCESLIIESYTSGSLLEKLEIMSNHSSSNGLEKEEATSLAFLRESNHEDTKTRRNTKSTNCSRFE